MSSISDSAFPRNTLHFCLLTCIPILFDSGLSHAATVPAGTTQNIDATTPLDTWQLETNASLIGLGAETLAITGTVGSTVNLTGSTVTSASASQGMFLTNASAILSRTTVTSAGGIGMSAVRGVASVGGSTVTLRDQSVVQGLQGGIAGNRFSNIDIQNSTVQGTGGSSFGIRLLEGTLSATSSTLTGGRNGLIVGTDTQASAIIPSTIVLDGTRVEGQGGSAIFVGFNAPNFPTIANITVRNHSTLIGANGTLLEVGPGASANLVVDDSVLKGNVEVASGSSANVTLQNNATLSGNLQNVTSATLNNRANMSGNVIGASTMLIDNASMLTGDLQNVANTTINNQSVMTGNVSGAANSVSALRLDNASTLIGQVNDVANFAIGNQALWQMTASQSVSNLALANGGRVKLGDGQQYFQLDVANLSGSGTFEMGTDFNRGISDLLNVTGSAAGNHQLLVSSTGLDPVSDASIKVVQSVAGTAEYGLVNSKVDAGAFTYKLIKEGNDWYLQPDKEVVSTPTRSVLAIFGTAPTVIYGEMASLNNRMGDLRNNSELTGGWVRSYGNRYSISNNAYGDGYSQNQYGLSMGVDTPIRLADETVLFGVFAGYSKSDLDLKRGSSGEIDSTSIGVYGTWLGESGYYLDTVAKLNHFRNDAKVTMSDGTRTKGDYNNLGASASVEFGKHIDISEDYYAEVFTQWQAASVQGKEYTLDNGLRADADTTRSMLGKVGVTLGRGTTLADGSIVQPHVRAAVVNEFVKNNEVRINDNKFNNDLSGGQFEVGAGVSWTLTGRWQMYAEVDTSKGENVSKDFGMGIGVHYQF